MGTRHAPILPSSYPPPKNYTKVLRNSVLARPQDFCILFFKVLGICYKMRCYIVQVPNTKYPI